MAFYGLIPQGTGGQLIEIEGQVNIEAPLQDGAFEVTLLGLPKTALRQAKLRWQSAMRNNGLSHPGYEVVVNLAPADCPKEGTTLEAPIVALLGVLGQTSEESEDIEELKKLKIEKPEKILSKIKVRNKKRRKMIQNVFNSDWVVIGELRLSGELKSTRSLLGMISKAPPGANIIIPKEAELEASVYLFNDKNAKIYCADQIGDVVSFMLGESIIKPIKNDFKAIANSFPKDPEREDVTNFAEISGQDVAKRALEIAVAGGHSVLLFGPHGEAKTMLAEAVPGVMPKLTPRECFEINQIYSAKGLLQEGRIKSFRPFRQVHTSASMVNLIGGKGDSGDIEPGEISLAHHGVLFLDELPQFPRATLEHLRTPLSKKRVVIGRATGSVEFQCNFALVAAMNPCVCGYYGEYRCDQCSKTIWKQNGRCEEHPEANTTHKCKCTPTAVKSYLGRLSGPFLDRIDLKIRVFSLNPDQRFTPGYREKSITIGNRIKKARKRQNQRYKGLPFSVNAELGNMQKYFPLLKLSSRAKREFERIQGEKDLSTRGAVKVLQVGRTIADLEGKEELNNGFYGLSVQRNGNTDRI